MLRRELADGAATTVHVARFELASTLARVVSIPMLPLEQWCAEQRVANAIVGGFFIRAAGMPLGDLWIDGSKHPSEDFSAPFGAQRACVEISAGRLSIAPRDEIPALPAGDLLQAGPLLLRNGRTAVIDGIDPEGFSAASAQFDSDITVGRYPRAAVGVGRGELIAAVCDGRSNDDAGLSLAELAELIRDLGAETAINLDGGGSASLVLDGVLRNSPREEHGLALEGGRPVSTALSFQAR